MLQTFWDETGSHDKKLLGLGGFVASADKWKGFTREWERIKKVYRIEDFHMRKLWKNNSKLFGHLDFDEKIALQIEIMKAIKNSVEMGFLFSVEEIKYNKLTTQRFRQDFGTAYTLLTQTCVEIVGEWSKENGTRILSAMYLKKGIKISAKRWSTYARQGV